MVNNLANLEKAKLNLETAKIPWSELQRFFASGLAIYVDQHLDLTEVAFQFSVDNKLLVSTWLAEKKIGQVSDQQATDWLKNQTNVWTVVVKPWILVQPIA